MDTPAIQEKEMSQNESPNEIPSTNQERFEPEKNSEVTEIPQEEIVEKEQPTEYLEGVREEMGKIASVASQQKFSNRVANDIVLQQEREKVEWKPILENKQHKKLEEEYHKISPKLLPFFDVLDQEKFTEQTKVNFDELKARYNIDVVQRWNESEIDKMFGKGLNPTSLITSLESAEWFEKNLPQSENPVVLEMGTGAGWSTVMLYNTLRESKPNGKIGQFSVDMSAHSIAATETLLNYSGIPYITVSDGEELGQIQEWLEKNESGKNFSGVILVLEKFNDVVEKFQDSSIDGIYSSHGTAYLSRNEYTDLLKKSERILTNDGLFVSDSLNPLYTNKLDTLFTLRQIMDPDGMKRVLDQKGVDYLYSNETLKNNSKYFLGQDVKVLKGFNTEHAYLILRWCNNLLKNLDFNRLIKTVKSLSVTMKVVDDYRADVFPSFMLEDVVRENNLKYEKLEGRPNFPIFMDTQGFRLTAK
mgnify:CR=1 FL=1